MEEELETPLEDPTIAAEAPSPLEESPIEGQVEEQGAKRRHLTTISFSGPLPPPELLKQYQAIQADFPERILRLTEQEAEHRREITRQAVRLEGREILIGQIFGLIVSLVGFGVAALLGLAGHPAAATLLGSGVIVALVTAFLKGRSRAPDDGARDEPGDETN